ALFLVIAVPIVAAVAIGLSVAYPRVRVGADGALVVRARRVAPSEVVGIRRSVSSGGNAGYLVYTLETSNGGGIRVLVAGAPIRGLGLAELGVLREVIAASAIPVGADPSELERSFFAANLLASGRRIEADRRLVLRELDGLRGAPHRSDAEPAVAEQVAVPTTSSSSPSADATIQDDREAERQLSGAAGTRIFRRVALGLFALACLAAAVLLIVLVVMESLGTDFGAADEDPLTATMSFAILA